MCFDILILLCHTTATADVFHWETGFYKTSRWPDTTTTTIRVQVSARGEDAGEGENGDDLQAWRNLMLMNVLLVAHIHVCVVLKDLSQLHTSFVLCALFSVTSSTHPQMKKIFSTHISSHYACFHPTIVFFVDLFYKIVQYLENHFTLHS